MAASLTAHILSDPVVFQDWPHYNEKGEYYNKLPFTGIFHLFLPINLTQFSGLRHFQWISPLKILTKSSLNQIHSLQHVVRVHNWPFADYGHMVQKTPNWMAKDAEVQEKQTGYMI